MANPYRVRTLKLASGEHLPVLMDTRLGMPLFTPTIYSLTQLRGRDLATNTIAQGLRHIMVLLLFLEQREIDIESRFREGRILDLAEIESLVNTCKLHVADMATVPQTVSVKPARVTTVERYRMCSLVVGPKTIDGQSAATRIRTIADYLSWLAKAQLLKLPAGSPSFLALETTRQMVIETLKARMPETGGRNTLDARMGLASDTATRLLAVTARNSQENPWVGEFIKCRNELIFRWLHSFGLRRGELLNVKVSDIDFRQETVTVVRRADAPEDPRSEQPVVKTRDRILPIPPDLCRLTHDYVLSARRKWSGARRHEYLFVADKTGAPLSLSALNKCFAFLRACIPDLPADLSPHVLRHTWNDNFSEAMDRIKAPAADEQKMRSFLMGWSETSGTAAKYTRRHVRKKANQISLLMQSKMTGEDDI
ncbi:site-specific integrase [Chromobacterium subtsugae]|uniref:site-specific integrase n=1 Tax=Chromobacterium subtsugae TaxID=251747 RepID=UPI000640CD82|nr:site-specific integrase [Chromobacterium subtsugae]